MANFLVKNFGYVDRRSTECDVGRHRRCYETHSVDQKPMRSVQELLVKYSWVAWVLVILSWGVTLLATWVTREPGVSCLAVIKELLH